MDEAAVTPCPASQREAALRGLHAAVTAGHQAMLAAAIAAAPDDPSTWNGLLVAPTADGADGFASLWVQPLPGRAALVWPPPPGAPAEAALYRAAARRLDSCGTAVAQIIVDPDDGFEPTRMAELGFPHLADLIYLAADADSSVAPADADLHFASVDRDDLDEFAALVEQTYLESLDCPPLDGVRSIDDVLAGYRAQGRYMPEHWYAVRVRGVAQPAAVVILADHPDIQQWELVYMGVAASHRGRGIGRRIVQFVRRAAARGGAQRVLLAVDAANWPALAVYQQAGFVEWGRRCVFARLARRAAARDATVGPSDRR